MLGGSFWVRFQRGLFHGRSRNSGISEAHLYQVEISGPWSRAIPRDVVLNDSTHVSAPYFSTSFAVLYRPARPAIAENAASCIAEHPDSRSDVKELLAIAELNLSFGSGRRPMDRG